MLKKFENFEVNENVNFQGIEMIGLINIKDEKVFVQFLPKSHEDEYDNKFISNLEKKLNTILPFSVRYDSRHPAAGIVFSADVFALTQDLTSFLRNNFR